MEETRSGNNATLVLDMKHIYNTSLVATIASRSNATIGSAEISLAEGESNNGTIDFSTTVLRCGITVGKLTGSLTLRMIDAAKDTALLVQLRRNVEHAQMRMEERRCCQ